MHCENASSLTDQIFAVRMHFIDAFFGCRTQGFLLP
jgi:hypothetical protein